MIAYLLASLPTPRLGDTPDVALDTVLERSAGFVGDDRARDLAWVLGVRPANERAGAGDDAVGEASPVKEPRPPLSDPATLAWAQFADLIDDAVVLERCARAKIDPQPYLRKPAGFRVDVSEGVAAAFGQPHPGAREHQLDELRWRLADELRVGDPDGFGALVARAVQLRLAWRRAGWNEEDGWRVLERAQRRIEERHA
ncbi:MAG: hypothetical protein K0A98_05175 [Trueperaceae bacterium]|nr:hypothetical protein [Trueperaceae bacterium]